MAVVVIATAIGTWINDNTKLFGDYLSDDDLNAAA
jgi:hypothetical protein